MQVCYFGTYERDYSRNEIFINALREVGIEVITINEEVREKDAKRYGSIIRLFFLSIRFFLAYLKLFFKLIRISKNDPIFIGYPSHIDVIFFYPVIKLKGQKIFFNPNVSLYDTFVYDRKLFKEGSLISKIIFFIDKLAFNFSDCIFIDTAAHRDYLSELFGIDKKKFVVVPVGAMDEFYKEEGGEKRKDFTVLYVGKYIPLHGIETIIEAANLLKMNNIKFTMIGTGQEYEKAVKIAKDNNVFNITFIDWLDRDKLVGEIDSSHVVLGIFKGEGKAMRVVPNKVYDALAAGAVTITERSPAILEFFKEDEEIFLVQPENSKELAEKILWIKDNYEEAKKVAQKGKEKLISFASKKELGLLIKGAIERFF